MDVMKNLHRKYSLFFGVDIATPASILITAEILKLTTAVYNLLM